MGERYSNDRLLICSQLQLWSFIAAMANTLTNDDVKEMVRLKIPDSIIIQKIKRSACKFDISPNALDNLNKSSVSEQVIMVMMER